MNLRSGQPVDRRRLAGGFIVYAVIFEVQPKKERWDEYLELAKHLKPILEKTDGFIDNERFASRRTEGRVLSLSTWRDEKAVVRWRTQGEHHAVQEKGRFEVFEDYHLRVGEVTRDTHPLEGLSLDQKRFDETETGTAKVITITEITSDESGSLSARPDHLSARLGLDPAAEGLAGQEVFESIYAPGKMLLLASWLGSDQAEIFKPGVIAGARLFRHRQVRIIRDYGMFDRREAPQFYPSVDAAREPQASRISG
jgi:heme-degrading monooxygenase HmoA